MVHSSNDETIFPHKLSLTNTQVLRLCKVFANDSSANIKFLKTQLSKMIQLGRYLGRLFWLPLKTGLPLMKNHSVKSVQVRSFSWSVFSRIRTEYREMRSILPYSVQMRENTDQKNSVFGHTSRSESTCPISKKHYP